MLTTKTFVSICHHTIDPFYPFCSTPNTYRRRQWQPTPVLLPGKSHGWRSLVGYSPWGREEFDTTEQLHFHTLEKEMATHSSVLAWRILGTVEPDGLPSIGSHRVGHDWSDLAKAAVGAAANTYPSHNRLLWFLLLRFFFNQTFFLIYLN